MVSASVVFVCAWPLALTWVVLYRVGGKCWGYPCGTLETRATNKTVREGAYFSLFPVDVLQWRPPGAQTSAPRPGFPRRTTCPRVDDSTDEGESQDPSYLAPRRPTAKEPVRKAQHTRGSPRLPRSTRGASLSKRWHFTRSSGQASGPVTRSALAGSVSTGAIPKSSRPQDRVSFRLRRRSSSGGRHSRPRRRLSDVWKSPPGSSLKQSAPGVASATRTASQGGAAGLPPGFSYVGGQPGALGPQPQIVDCSSSDRWVDSQSSGSSGSDTVAVSDGQGILCGPE